MKPTYTWSRRRAPSRRRAASQGETLKFLWWVVLLMWPLFAVGWRWGLLWLTGELALALTVWWLRQPPTDPLVVAHRELVLHAARKKRLEQQEQATAAAHLAEEQALLDQWQAEEDIANLARELDLPNPTIAEYEAMLTKLDKESRVLD